MLKIEVDGGEFFNNETAEFFEVSRQQLHLEHSLLSIQKWESKHQKPFLEQSTKLTNDEIIDYVRCMTVNTVNPLIYTMLSNTNLNDIMEYIQSPQTATWFADDNRGVKKGKPVSRREKITVEIIYYKMFSYQIPKECERWHINRLLTLLKVFDVKNQDPKKVPKVSKKDAAAQRRALNEQRLQQLNTKG